MFEGINFAVASIPALGGIVILGFLARRVRPGAVWLGFERASPSGA